VTAVTYPYQDHYFTDSAQFLLSFIYTVYRVS